MRRHPSCGGASAPWRGAGASAVVAAALLLAAASVEAKRLPLPDPDPERGSIATCLRARFPAGTISPAVQVYFVRLGDEVDRYSAESVLPSNLARNKQVFLLNARPGRYVAVAARVRGRSAGEFKMFLDQAAIDRSEVEVRPGQIVFMGDFFVDAKLKTAKADAAQAHYMRLLAPDAAGRRLMTRAFTAKYIYPAELVRLDRDWATEAELLGQARVTVFKDEADWQGLLDEEMKRSRERDSKAGASRSDAFGRRW